MAKATPRPGRRANATAASGVAASPSTSISTKKRSAAVIPCGETLMSRPVMTTFERIAELPLTIDGYALEGRERRDLDRSSSACTTTFHLQGGGEEGLGEDVTYDPEDQRAQQARGPTLPLAGDVDVRRVLASTSAGSTSSRPARPSMPAFRYYRRWAIESAALDLALRQAGPLAGRGARPRAQSPIHFVVSLRLGEPAELRPGRPPPRAPTRGCASSSTRTPDWDQELIDRLAATGAVASIDFKGAYKGTPVDVDTDPAFYRRIAEAFPDAWLEDPDLTDPEADAALEPYRDRITWDAPIHSVADIEGLAVRAAHGQLQAVALRLAAARCSPSTTTATSAGSSIYGGGQSELGVGRGQIQCSPRCSIPTASTTSRRRATTGPTSRSRAARRARSIPTPSPPASAGGRRLSAPCRPSRARSRWRASPRSPRCSSSRRARTRSSRPRRASAPPPRRSSAPAPPSARTPSARASTSAPRSPPRGRRSACSCGGWPRRRWRSPSAARATSRRRPRSSARRRRPTASCWRCASWAWSRRRRARRCGCGRAASC